MSRKYKFHNKSGLYFVSFASNRAMVYKGLSPIYHDRKVPLWLYTHTAAHELGHAIFSFKHNTHKGSIMYRTNKGITPSSNFIEKNQKTIRNSIWGQN